MKIYPFNHVLKDMGKSSQSCYLYDYLTELKAETVIAEDKYIDKDYLIDYSNFYSRSFKPYDRFTLRLHFFSKTFSESDFRKIFDSDIEFLNLLTNSYLGFVVVKPINSPDDGEPFIGRSVLQTYPSQDKDENRHFIAHENPVSLFGIPLNVKSLPYQTQDSIVAACATTAIWVSLYALNSLFGTQRYSPFEITKTSVSFPGLERNFPSSGLNIFQMKNYFNSMGLETEFINVERAPPSVRKQIVSDATKAYLDLGLPVIACIQLINEGYPDLHAVVITGYRSDNHGNLKELYIHDDHIGPYSRVLPKNNDGDLSHWDNEWISVDGYKDIIVEKLLIPIYPKIRLTFKSIYDVYLSIKKRNSYKIHNTELYLKEINSYKKYLLNQNFKMKYELLLKQFPRFLWVIRIGTKDTPKLDIVFDAISLDVEPFCVIDFD